MPSTQSSPSRRRLLESVPALATVGLAGCLNDTEPGAPVSQTTTNGSDPTEKHMSETDQADAGGAAWPQFGAGPRNAGHTATVRGPGASEASVAWRYDAGTPTMNTSPVVVDGTVYAPGSGDPGLVHAIDAETGEQQWEFEPAGYASSAPAVVDGTLYVGTWGKRFYAVDAATGDLEWQREISHRFGRSSPAVVDDTVFVGTNGDGPLVVSSEGDEEEFEACALLALDAATGDERWRYDDFGEKDDVDSSPAVANGRVHFSSEGTLYTLDAGSGRVVWTRAVRVHPHASPTVVDGVVYCAGRTEDGAAVLYAFDAASGGTAWSATLDDQSFRTSPAVADGTVYVAASSTRVCTGNEDCSGVTRGQLYAFDAATGDRTWTADIETDTRSSPAVADGVVYVGCRDGLSAVTTDGDNAWRINFDGKREDGPYVNSSPAVADGVVYIGASDGRLRAIRAQN